MVYKVKLVQEITLNVESDSEDAVWDWLLNTTPDEAAALVKGNCNYHEDVLREMPAGTKPDYRLK